MSPVQPSYPGVYLEETRSTVKVIPGVKSKIPQSATLKKKLLPSALLAQGYKIVKSQIEPGGLALLLAKGTKHLLVRMTDVRSANSVQGHLVVTFVAPVP